MTKVLFLSTSASHLKGGPTGLWLEELATPYFSFKNAGYDITFSSPAGGPVPIDSASMKGAFLTDDCKKFLHDADAMGMLSHTKKIADVESGDYDVLYLTGGHGCCVDFINNGDVKSAVETTHSSGKILATVCHGAIALADCCKPDGTTPLVKDLKVTGFSDAEEAMVQLTEVVPFLVESRFSEQGAKYEKAEAAWGSHVCVDGKLITGQNPGSSLATAEKVLELLA